MATLKLLNTLTKELTEFVPEKPNQVRMYICGPTVYDSPHIGHARTYISFDIIRRVLSGYFGYNVTLVMNITDIEDKIIARAAERGVTCDALTAQYEDEFFKATDRLGILRPDFTTRVTDYVKETVEFVERLERNGLTYTVDGSVYMDLERYKERHKYNLLRPAVKDPETEAAPGKRNREDFVLWKASKAGEPRYDSPWGAGRPGWHIECSAMSSAVFGETLDIHAGGIDLAFPHHENEIAQCQGAFGRAWVRYFLHTGHLNIHGRKMSKSLKNFLTIDDLLAQASPQALRVLFLRRQWNRDMDYDEEQLKEAAAHCKRLANFLSTAEAVARRNDRRALQLADRAHLEFIAEQMTAVHEAFCNNINIPQAFEAVLTVINKTNTGLSELHSDVVAQARNFVARIAGLLGLLGSEEAGDAKAPADGGIVELLAAFRCDVRKAAKEKRDPAAFFQLSDRVRDEVKERGYMIEDGPDGTVVRKVTNM